MSETEWRAAFASFETCGSCGSEINPRRKAGCEVCRSVIHYWRDCARLDSYYGAEGQRKFDATWPQGKPSVMPDCNR